MKSFAIQKRLLMLLLLQDIVDWALVTLSTTFFVKANVDEMLSSKTRTLFRSNVPMTWWKTVRLVHSCFSDQSSLIGIGTQRRFATAIYRLICRSLQATDYVIAQTPGSFPHSFISPTGWNSPKFCTMNTQNVPTLQVFQSFSHNCKSLFFQSCLKELIRFLCESILNLLKRNLQSIKRHHVAKFHSEVWLLFLKIITWNQRKDVLASEKALQLIKVISPPVSYAFFWYGAACSCPCFSVQQAQQEFE